MTVYDVCKSKLKYKYCYGPSWGCQEVKSDFTASSDRTHTTSDKVVAWIKYCFVGYNNNWSWNTGYEFDINGNMNQHLATTGRHNFKIKSSIGEYYTTDSQDGGKHEFHRLHTSENISMKRDKQDDWHHLYLNVDMAGTYKFHFDPVSKLLTIQFPEKGYRLKITMTDGSEKVYTSNAVDDETEILSFFAPGTNDPNLKGTITLEHLGSIVSGFTAPKNLRKHLIILIKMVLLILRSMMVITISVPMVPTAVGATTKPIVTTR